MAGKYLSRAKLAAVVIDLVRALDEASDARAANLSADWRDLEEYEATRNRSTRANVRVGQAVYDLAALLYPQDWASRRSFCDAVIRRDPAVSVPTSAPVAA